MDKLLYGHLILILCSLIAKIYIGWAQTTLLHVHVNLFNLYLTNGFSHHYHFGETTLIFRDVRSDFYLLSNFSMKFLEANRIAPDGTPRSAASHLGLFCLPMSHKKDVRLK